jgi:hypothetical protein
MDINKVIHSFWFLFYLGGTISTCHSIFKVIVKSSINQQYGFYIFCFIIVIATYTVIQIWNMLFPEPELLSVNSSEPKYLAIYNIVNEDSYHPNLLNLKKIKFDKCCICYDYQANTILIPCNHYDFCNHCIDIIYKDNKLCPICRQQIEMILIYQK